MRSLVNFAISLCLLAGLPAPVAGQDGPTTVISDGELAAHRRERDQLFSQGVEYAKQERLYSAIESVQAALAIQCEWFGARTPEVCVALECIAVCQERQVDFATALNTWRELQAITVDLCGPEHWSTRSVQAARQSCAQATRLSPIDQQRLAKAARAHGQAELAIAAGNYALAREHAVAVLSVRDKLLGDDAVTAANLHNLGACLLGLGDSKSARPYLERCATIREQSYGLNHPLTLASLTNLSNAYQTLGDYRLQRPVLDRLVAGSEALHGAEHLLTARARVSLATIALVTKDQTCAAAQARLAWNTLRAALGESHFETVEALHILGKSLPALGEHAQAERIYRQVVAHYAAAHGDHDPRTATALFELGILYSGWNDYGDAEVCLARSYEGFCQALGAEHAETAGVLIMLATVNARLGRTDLAEEQATQALTSTRQSLGADHPQIGAMLLALGNIYLFQKKLDQAEATLTALLADREARFPQERYQNSIIAEKLAGIALRLGNYETALARAQAVLDVYHTELPESHPHWSDILLIAGIAHLAQHHDDEAAASAARALRIARTQLDSAAMAQSERQQLALTYRLREILDLSLSLPPARADAEATYAHVLSWKGAIQARQIRDRRERPAEVERSVAELQQVCSRLATLSLQVPNPPEQPDWLKQVDALKARQETLEAELTARSHDFRAGRQTAAVTVSQLQAALPADAALVDVLEYVAFTKGPNAETPDENRYVAFVVRRDQPVVRLELGAAQTINDLVDRWRSECLFEADAYAKEPALQLRDLVWRPVEEQLAGCKTVLFSPDSGLARVPLAALPGREPRSYLIEDYAIGLMPVPQLLPEMLAAPREVPLAPKLLLVGDIDYEASPSEKNSPAEPSGGQTLVSFPPLKSARAEMQVLRGLYEQHFPQGALTVLEKSHASEAAFRAQAGQHDVLLLATHGFFAAPGVTAALAVQDQLVGLDANRSSRAGALSGLALAGVNRLASADSDDGILTASEVAALDLRGVQLAILSGCETGLGKNAYGEGAMGLQRAFQLAGARTTVASLWSVPDQKTSQLIDRFAGSLWTRQLPTLAALQEAQQWMLRTGGKTASTASDSPRQAPYCWAAFVLSGDWR